MEKRQRPRFPKRMTCEIKAGEKRAMGIIRDLSENGLFVQTHLSAPPDSLVDVLLASTDCTPKFDFEAGVARKRIIPRHLQTSVPSGLGLEIIPPGRDFGRLVATLESQNARSQSPQVGEAPNHKDLIRAFRFRMIRRDVKGPPRLLTVRCQTEAGARARALARSGAGWKISDVQRL